jgi:hypothetical protein
MIRVRFFTSVAAASLVALATAGCNGGGSSDTIVSSTPCPSLAMAPPTLVTPANTSTGVSDTIGSITLTNATASETVTLVPSSGTSLTGSSPVYDQANQTWVATIPALAAHTTYSVSIGLIPSGCSGTTSTIGAFTSQ